MRTLLCVASILALSGCAATPAQNASRLTSPTLCYVNFAGDANDKAVTTAELGRRGFACRVEDVYVGQQEWAQLKAQQAARNQAASDRMFELGLMLLARPPAPAPTTCTTSYFQNVATTTCR